MVNLTDLKPKQFIRHFLALVFVGVYVYEETVVGQASPVIQNTVAMIIAFYFAEEATARGVENGGANGKPERVGG